MAKFLILGGTGAAGMLIARHLLAHSGAEVTIASRQIAKAEMLAVDLAQRYPGRAAAVRAAAADEASLAAALPGHDMVIAASPTPAYAGQVARAALKAGADYLDIQLGAKKLAALKSLSGEIEKSGRCFITEAGFHPGLPAALVRYAASHFDRLESAVTAGYLGINREIPYSDAVDELVELFKHPQGQVYTKGRWTKPGQWQMRKIDFGGDIGVKRCYSMFFEELRDLPALDPSLKETGFFISESHWFTDMAVIPAAIVLLKLFPYAVRTAGRLIWWGMMKFRKPPFRTELIVRATGLHAGQPTEFAASVAHSDAYELTAIPVAAALLQYLDGSARKPGLWLMGHFADPARLMTDMKRLGVKLKTSTQ